MAEGKGRNSQNFFPFPYLLEEEKALIAEDPFPEAALPENGDQGAGTTVFSKKRESWILLAGWAGFFSMDTAYRISSSWSTKLDFSAACDTTSDGNSSVKPDIGTLHLHTWLQADVGLQLR